MPKARQRAEISLTATGDATIIAGVAGHSIRLHKLVLWARAAVNVILKEGTATIQGLGWNLPAQSGFVYDGEERGTDLVSGTAFIVNVDVANALMGWAEYRIEA